VAVAECYNDSPDYLSWAVDEGHRSQNGENNYCRMAKLAQKRRLLAFTGTPLLQDDKKLNKVRQIILPTPCNKRWKNKNGYAVVCTKNCKARTQPQ